MSEIQEWHTISQPIGVPSGYVDYNDAGQLRGAARRKPYVVLLFSEFSYLMFSPPVSIADHKEATLDSHSPLLYI